MSEGSTRPPGRGRAPVLRPVSTAPAGQLVADRLVTAIALGQFAVGERLPAERELASMLQVSRTTVRDGVARLVQSGYVRVERGRAGGIFVESASGRDAGEMIGRTLDSHWPNLEELLDFRTIVEAEIARLAARRRNSRNVRAIRAAVDAYAEAGPDRASSSAADLHLHQTIASATANSRLTRLSLEIRREVTLGIGAEPWSPELRLRALAQHPELALAVIEGDAIQAGLLAAEHFSLTEQTLRSLLHAAHESERIPHTQPGRANAKSGH
jgi:GntR family transcriptional repressor for pyruvate dehydrogenase complex